ncbi:MAG: hypothetical protein RL637_553 [Pseudomonadota bacterium]|jgi:uncharacterized protein (UPF0264 family)
MKLLASVKNLSEALIAEQLSVDLIDLKQPDYGALGALPLENIREIVTQLNKPIPISATVGDIPFEIEILAPLIYQMASAKVNYIKIGLFSSTDYLFTIKQLTNIANQFNLIAVFFADGSPNFQFIPLLKEAGFKGVMLDTVNKSLGSLTTILTIDQIREFVMIAKAQQLLCGLAGSLKMTDIDLLFPLNPDYLGFRGAICYKQQRISELDSVALNRIQQYLARI